MSVQPPPPPPSHGVAPSQSAPPPPTTKAKAKAKKAWYLRWWVWVIAAIVLIGAISNLAGGGKNTEADDAASEAVASQEATTPDAGQAPVAEEPEPTVEPEEPGPTVAPEEPAAKAGTVANPLPQPYVARGLLGGEKYSLEAHVVNATANAQVAEWNMFNTEAPSGFTYVVVEMTMTGIDADGVEPSLATFDLRLATSEGNRYDSEFIVFGEGMPSMMDGPTLYPGSSFTGYAAYIVPEASQSFLLYDNSNYIALP